ncbi:MAG: nodulation protein NfeD [Nitrososphaerales archaeon]
MSLKIVAIILISLGLLSISNSNAQDDKVLWVELNGFISPASAERIALAIEYAVREDYKAILLTLDTFGGSADSMFKIIDSINFSPIPVIGYVYPPTKQALSAGTLILIATDYAAMANYTTIGSSQPVVGLTPVNDSKIINALVEKVRTLAQLHRRNETQIIRFITQNDNLTPEKALKFKVIEAIASNPGELLEKVHGKKVYRLEGEKILNTKGKLVKYEPSLRVSILDVLSDPLISSLLIALGFLTLILGLASPGFGVEIAGIVAILLGLVGQGFNINYAAIILMALGSGLIAYEIYTPGFGILGFSGIVSLGLGISFMVTQPFSPLLISQEYVINFLRTIFASLSLLGGFFAFMIYKIAKVRRIKSPLQSYPKGVGKALDDLDKDKEGFIIIEGEYWKAISEKPIKAGSKVVVLEKRGTILLVKEAEEYKS